MKSSFAKHEGGFCLGWNHWSAAAPGCPSDTSPPTSLTYATWDSTALQQSCASSICTPPPPLPSPATSGPWALIALLPIATGGSLKSDRGEDEGLVKTSSALIVFYFLPSPSSSWHMNIKWGADAVDAAQLLLKVSHPSDELLLFCAAPPLEVGWSEWKTWLSNIWLRVTQRESWGAVEKLTYKISNGFQYINPLFPVIMP